MTISTKYKYTLTDPGIELSTTISQFANQRFYPLGHGHLGHNIIACQSSVSIDTVLIE